MRFSFARTRGLTALLVGGGLLAILFSPRTPVVANEDYDPLPNYCCKEGYWKSTAAMDSSCYHWCGEVGNCNTYGPYPRWVAAQCLADPILLCYLTDLTSAPNPAYTCATGVPCGLFNSLIECPAVANTTTASYVKRICTTGTAKCP